MGKWRTEFFYCCWQNAQDQIWKHTQEVQAVQQQMGDNIIRNWEQRNASSSSNSTLNANSDGFGQYLRGVDSWTDEGGNKVELTSGYSNAWSKGDGSLC